MIKKIYSFTAIIILCLFFFSCTHKITRTGYALEKSQWKDCEIAITQDADAKSSSMTLVGQIRLNDSGFSTKCNQSEAMKILKGEGCALNADLILITEEKQPNLGSTCYRCVASFYKGEIENDTLMSEEYKQNLAYEIKKEDEEAKKKNRTAFWVSFAVGFVIGFLLVSGS